MTVRRLRVGAPDEFELNRIRMLTAAGAEIGVVRTEAGFFAMRNSCPHQKAPICEGTVGGTALPSAPDDRSYGLRGQVIRCPWHGWEFLMATGECLFGTSRKRLVTYQVEVSGDGVFISTKGAVTGQRP